MEPANLHPHQEQYAGYFSSLLFQPECKVSSTNHLNPGIFLESWAANGGSNMCESLMNLNDATSSSFTQQSANELLLANIKEEMPDSFPKLTSPNYNLKESNSLSSKTYYSFDHPILTNFSSGHHIQLPAAGDLYSDNAHNPTSDLDISSASCKYEFSHILPSFSMFSNSLGLNLQAVDLLAAKYDDGNSTHQTPQNNVDHYFMRDINKESPSSSSNKTTVFVDRNERKKRAINISESNNFPSDNKKHKPSSRSTSCPPIKKEKIRERIATLQRLIAPYGKTDTASVLTETIGYIQFLHDQVQTLSVPYMKSSNINPPTTHQAILRKEDGKEQPKRDLLSRGLCLVPLSSASFFSNFNGGI